MRKTLVVLFGFVCFAPIRLDANGTANIVAVAVERAPDHAYVVTGAFDVTASPEIVWQVLTDYDGIGGFVSSIKQSTIKHRADGHVLLEQQGVGRAWFVSLPIHVILDVEEDGNHTALTFHDVCGKSFTTYEGKWELTTAAGGTHVTYELKADPVGSQPGFVAKPAMRANVQKLLDEVRQEILTRSGR